MAKRSPQHHDGSYKLLFSHPEMVQDLIRGFVHEAWVEQVDFSTLERAHEGLVSDRLDQRFEDIAWKLRWRDGYIYLFILMEFQSTEDRLMAVRMNAYNALFFQALVRHGQLTPGGKLPPVLSIVLYNGLRAWQSSCDLADCIESVAGGLEAYQPSFRYLLIDERRRAAEGPPWNLVTALFQLEASQGPAEVRCVLDSLVKWLDVPSRAALRRAFTNYIARSFLPSRMPDQQIPQLTDLQEFKTMLDEEELTWTERWKREGFAEGVHRGEMQMLIRQLERKFGPPSSELKAKIESADAEQLLSWGEQMVTAKTLDQVFQI